MKVLASTHTRKWLWQIKQYSDIMPLYKLSCTIYPWCVLHSRIYFFFQDVKCFNEIIQDDFITNIHIHYTRNIHLSLLICWMCIYSDVKFVNDFCFLHQTIYWFVTSFMCVYGWPAEMMSHISLRISVKYFFYQNAFHHIFDVQTINENFSKACLTNYLFLMKKKLLSAEDLKLYCRGIKSTFKLMKRSAYNILYRVKKIVVVPLRKI